MVTIERYQRIYELIARRISFGLETEEEEELRMWIEETEENRKLYARITDTDYLKQQEKKRNSIIIRDNWTQLERKLGRGRNQYSLRNYWKYVAVVVLLLGVGIVGGLVKHEPGETMVQAELIHPGVPKAHLILANGDRVELEKERSGLQILDCDGTLIRNDSTGLRYNTEKAGLLVSSRHTLLIPKGGEYIMTLQDGTVVYLNSESKIEYPVQFIDKNREVYLEGEAYFKVAHDEKHPFIVKTRNMDVKVLGTEFNVKAYTDEHLVQTTLVKGKVAVLTGNAKRIENQLVSNQQATLDLEQGKLEVEEVDVAPFIAWKNGQFMFKGERLEDIMTVLERWYDFEVFYQGEWIKNIEFAGKLNRSGSIEPILDVIRSTHKINVDINNRTIVFSAKK